MLEKVEVMRMYQNHRNDVCEKLREVIANTHNYRCDSIDTFWIGVKDISVTYGWYCRGNFTLDTIDIPIAWLDDGFDYKSAYAEGESKKLLEDIARAKKAKAAAKARKESKERRMYLKLKRKYGGDEQVDTKTEGVV